MATEDKIRELRDQIVENYCGCLERVCESPIEKLFLWALMARTNEFDRMLSEVGRAATEYHCGAPNGAAFAGVYEAAVAPGGQAFWFLQWKDREYRIDIAIVLFHGPRLKLRDRICVELDGHDFHERTKRQATRDKRRDRALTERGWRVVRFTGSEVYEDAYECVSQVFSLIDSVVSARAAEAS